MGMDIRTHLGYGVRLTRAEIQQTEREHDHLDDEDWPETMGSDIKIAYWGWWSGDDPEGCGCVVFVAESAVKLFDLRRGGTGPPHQILPDQLHPTTSAIYDSALRAAFDRLGLPVPGAAGWYVVTDVSV